MQAIVDKGLSHNDKELLLHTKYVPQTVLYRTSWILQRLFVDSLAVAVRVVDRADYVAKKAKEFAERADERAQKRKLEADSEDASTSTGTSDEQASKRQKTADKPAVDKGLLIKFEGIGEDGATFKDLKAEFLKHSPTLVYVEVDEAGTYVWWWRCARANPSACIGATT
jgi:hypothetical protein